MSERLPYEEQLPQHLRDFPLPDENSAWADMKRRLDEDDDDGAIVWWKRGCALWIGLALLVALAITGWWYFNRERTDHATSSGVISDPSPVKMPDTDYKDSLTNRSAARLPVTPIDSISQTSPAFLPDTIVSARKSGVSLKKNERLADTKTTKENPEDDRSKKIKRSSGETVTVSRKNSGKRQRSAKNDFTDTAAINNDRLTQTPVNFPVDSIKHFIAGDNPAGKPVTPATSPSGKLPVDSIKAFVTGDTSIDKQKDSSLAFKKDLPVDSIRAFVTGDTTGRKNKYPVPPKVDSLHPKDSSINKTDSTEKEFFLSAGLAITQQIPLAGQKAVPYGSQGREFSIADYIPSVYLRFNKKHRWFVQGEFRYGAPQFTKPVTYSIETDTSSTAPILRSEKTLQKTYYHQLPVSFNYYITRDWALGAGIVWNRFSKSIFEDNQQLRNPLNPADTFYVKETMVSKDPTREGLSRSYFQGLIESQYQWKKFSFGARYTFGLSPYLRFTLPGEAEQKERNQSLQFFIRYNLWTKSLKE
jgi:hypothetical protein